MVPLRRLANAKTSVRTHQLFPNRHMAKIKYWNPFPPDPNANLYRKCGTC